MKRIVLLGTAILFASLTYAQREEIIPATKADSAFFTVDKDGKIYRDSFKATLDANQVKGLEEAAIQQVVDLNLYFSELWKTWTDVKGQGKYSSEEDFYNEKKEYAKKTLGLIIYDGEKGIENILQLYRAYSSANGSYYRWKKKPGTTDEYYKVAALHVGRDEKNNLRDSVYEDFIIPAAKIWVTNKYSSWKNSPTVKQYVANIQTSSKKNRGGLISFKGGEYVFTDKLKYNAKNKRYEGAIDYWQEFRKTTPEGYEYSDRTHRRIIVYIEPTVETIDGKDYVGWVIKFGNIKALETTSL
ncbi:MAG: hypothetical protein IKJ40_01565 [Bacteroidales bacterium]|nr:hypothetical protein [Bacteroidales bacterium]